MTILTGAPFWKSPVRRRRRPRAIAAATAALVAVAASAAWVGNGGTAGCSSTSFGAGSWPPACWSPFAKGSPFNKPLPAHPRVLPNSDQIIGTIFRNAITPAPEDVEARINGHSGVPTYYSRARDPLVAVHCIEQWGKCVLEGRRIRIPAGATPEGEPENRRMTVVDQRAGWEYDLWKVQAARVSSGVRTLNVHWATRSKLDGLGNDSGQTPAGFAHLAGRVRVEELKAGRIGHALAILPSCTSGRTVYPAQGKNSDPTCRKGGSRPAIGARIQLRMTREEIDALALPAWKRTYLHAMAEYGMFVAGCCAGGLFALEKESGQMYSSLGYPDEWVKFGMENEFLYWPGSKSYPERAYVGKWNEGDIPQGRLQVIDPCVSRETC